MTNFQENRKAQMVNALRDAGAKQVKPIKPKSEAELETERSAAAVALNAAFLKQRQERFGKTQAKPTRHQSAVDALTEALTAQDDE